MSEAFTQSLGEKTGENVATILEKWFIASSKQTGDLYSKSRVKFKTGFENYLLQTFERCSKTKTIINRLDPVNIRDIHVPLHFKIKDAVYLERAVSDIVMQGRQVVITGIAGCGKSMSMKSIYLDLAQSGQVIPVFAELRHAAEYEGGLLPYLASQIGAFIGGISEEVITYGVRNGYIALILDGFDEIAKDKKGIVEKQILEIVHTAPLAKMLVSGRPNQRYESWQSFSHASTQLLDKDQAETLISRIQYDNASKERFLSRLKSELYRTHKPLLGNPLLCSMMLLTFDEFSDMPSKMTTFYRKAFEVLFRKHDALKPQYVREFKCNIAEDDFFRVMEVFCFLSYADESYSFESKQPFSYAKEALEYEFFENLSGEDFIEDVVDNVCLILKEGDHFSFLHRSFQEYFAASFAVGRGREDLVEIVEVLSNTWMDTSVVKFMADMNQEALERGYIMKVIPNIIAEIRSRQSAADVFAMFLTGFDVTNNSVDVYLTIDEEKTPEYANHLEVLETISGKKFSMSFLEDFLADQVKSLGVSEIDIEFEHGDEKFEMLMAKSDLPDRMVDYLTSILSEVQHRMQLRDALALRRSRARSVM